MYIWINKFTCLGSVFFPCKPRAKDNEYHTICCDENGIIYGLDIVELNYRPIIMGVTYFEKIGNIKISSLMLRLTRALCTTWKSVVM